MATMAHRFALVNQNLTADVIEAVEFPELAKRYGVMAVPKTIINDRVEGAIPEREFAELRPSEDEGCPSSSLGRRTTSGRG
ncbi:thioredoxin family protein [Candidatus Bathyarchaeota archaeon]|nr:thioredoxin family protein [Candidatus Bathyarchaeota archaeon]